MDFTTYETFLENLSVIVRGIANLIQEAEWNAGKPLLWSPLGPNIIKRGSLTHNEWGIGYTNSSSIQQAILEHLDDDNYVVELTYNIDSFGNDVYSLYIGY